MLELRRDSFRSGIKQFCKNSLRNAPLKKELFQIIRLVFNPPHEIYQHLYFVGNFEVKVSEDKSFLLRHHGYRLENELFWRGLYGGWEKNSLRVWVSLAQESSVILDIGANTGIYALAAQAQNPEAKVFAFEPVERVFQKLSYNVGLNNFKISCIQKALSNFDGKALIFDSDTEHTYSVTVNRNTLVNPDEAIPIEIETVRLDTFISQNQIPSLDLIKIDVETHEVEVLEGLREHFDQFRPTILIEVLNREVGEGIEDCVSGLGYLFFQINEKDGLHGVKKIVPSDHRNFLLCQSNIIPKLELLDS